MSFLYFEDIFQETRPQNRERIGIEKTEIKKGYSFEIGSYG